MKTIFYKGIIALIGVFISVNVSAQTSALLSSNSRNYTFNFSLNNQQGSPEITRFMIDALAQGANKPAFNVNYSISFDQTLELLLVNNVMQINTRNKFIQPTGDVYYRNFYGPWLKKTIAQPALNIDVKIEK
mgnify:CR=1 FL=1